MPVIKNPPPSPPPSPSTSSNPEQPTTSQPGARNIRLAQRRYNLSTPSPEERQRYFVSGQLEDSQQQSDPPRVGAFTAAGTQSPEDTQTGADQDQTSPAAPQGADRPICGAEFMGGASSVHKHSAEDNMACAHAVHHVAYDDVRVEYPKAKMLEMAMLARYPYCTDDSSISSWTWEDAATQSTTTYQWHWEIDRDTSAEVAQQAGVSFRHRDGVIRHDGLVAYLMKQRDKQHYCLTFGGTTSGSTASNSMAVRMLHNAAETTKQWGVNTKAFVGHIPDMYKTAEKIVGAANQIAKDRGGKLVVTGHSLGGAMATFATAIQRAQGYDVRAYPFSSAPLNRRMEKTIIKALKDGTSMESVVDGIIETHVKNDIVPKVNNPVGTLNLFGKTITITSPDNPGPLNAHDNFLSHIKAFTNPAADTKVRCDTTNRLFKSEIVSSRPGYLVTTDSVEEKILRFVEKCEYEGASSEHYYFKILTPFQLRLTNGFVIPVECVSRSSSDTDYKLTFGDGIRHYPQDDYIGCRLEPIPTDRMLSSQDILSASASGLMVRQSATQKVRIPLEEHQSGRSFDQKNNTQLRLRGGKVIAIEKLSVTTSGDHRIRFKSSVTGLTKQDYDGSYVENIEILSADGFTE